MQTGMSLKQVITTVYFPVLFNLGKWNYSLLTKNYSEVIAPFYENWNENCSNVCSKKINKTSTAIRLLNQTSIWPNHIFNTSGIYF